MTRNRKKSPTIEILSDNIKSPIVDFGVLFHFHAICNRLTWTN